MSGYTVNYIKHKYMILTLSHMFKVFLNIFKNTKGNKEHASHTKKYKK